MYHVKRDTISRWQTEASAPEFVPQPAVALRPALGEITNMARATKSPLWALIGYKESYIIRSLYIIYIYMSPLSPIEKIQIDRSEKTLGG